MKKLNLKKAITTTLALLMILSAAAIPAFAAETNIPKDILIAPNPLATQQDQAPLIAPNPLIAPAPAEGTGDVYTVAKGDTLWKIAKAVLGNGNLWKEIYEANRGIIKNPNLILIGQTLTIPAKQSDEPAIGGMQIPNPFIDFDTMEDAAKLTGFTLKLHKAADKLQVMNGTMIQALYGEDGNDMTIRKAAGSGDISGDYNAYAQIENADGVTLKGESNGFNLAIWENDGYTYSVSVSQALSQADMMAIVTAIK